MSMNRAGSGVSAEDLRCIHTAQILLHLLPTPNFSLLIYLLSFFSQVVMVSEENGLAVEDVGSMFGTIFFGGYTEGRKDTKISRGDLMLRWFLQRWKQIYNGLLPHDDDRPISKSKVIGKPSSIIQVPDDSPSGNINESAPVCEEPVVHSAAKGTSPLASSSTCNLRTIAHLADLNKCYLICKIISQLNLSTNAQIDLSKSPR